MERTDNTYVQLCGRFVIELHGRRVDERVPSRQGRALSKLRAAVGADVLDGALEAYAAACLGLGGTELAGAERAARRLLEHHPLRETGHRLLMQALAARGNVAEAFQVCERARTALRDEPGIPPGPAIHEVHATLLGRT